MGAEGLGKLVDDFRHLHSNCLCAFWAPVFFPLFYTSSYKTAGGQAAVFCVKLAFVIGHTALFSHVLYVFVTDLFVCL